jgi:hypothetical protein
MKISFTPKYGGIISNITVFPYRDGTVVVEIDEPNGAHHEIYLDSKFHIPIYGSIADYPDEAGDKLKYLDCASPMVADILKVLDAKIDDEDADYVSKWLRHYRDYRSEL